MRLTCCAVRGSSRESSGPLLDTLLSTSAVLLSLPLSLILALGLSACGGGGGGGGGGDDDDTSDGSDDGSGADAGPGFDQAPLIEGLATLAGWETPGVADGDREHALFNNPVNVVVTGGGDILVADFDNSLIRRVTPEGDVTTVSAPPDEGMFVRPFGLALSGDTLYVQTDGNSLGQPGTPGGALWRMPAGGGAPELLSDNIGRCRGLALLSDGRLAMTDFRAHVIQIYDPASSAISLLAGGLNAPGYRDGQSTEASFNQPYDLLELADGTILVADFGNNRLRAVALDGTVTTFAGTGAAGRDDGALATASFNAPQGLTMDDAGNIYVTDTGNYLIRKISPDGQVTTVAGNASPGYRDDEDPLAGQLFGIEGIDIGGDGYAYIADGTRGENAPYHRVRRLTLE